MLTRGVECRGHARMTAIIKIDGPQHTHDTFAPRSMLAHRAIFANRAVMARPFLNSAPRRLLSKEVSTEVGTVTSGSGKWHPADRAGMKRSDPVEGFMLAGILSGTCFIACVPFFSWMLTAH